ncbi:MAG: hypothetical protein H6613_07235 [Ignavibacteriales bacterium]|nr:hypothetical protein [Ignavibacteriales bacterium]
MKIFSEDGFTFQGYNIYQIAYDPSHKTSGKRIFTFDVVDNITNITGERYDPITGELITGVIFEGTNSGIQNMLL